MLKEYYKLHKSNEELIGLIDVLKEKKSKVLNGSWGYAGFSVIR